TLRSQRVKQRSSPTPCPYKEKTSATPSLPHHSLVIRHQLWHLYLPPSTCLGVRECGGIGRRAGFRYQWVTPCRFESGHSHEHLAGPEIAVETAPRGAVSTRPST